MLYIHALVVGVWTGALTLKNSKAVSFEYACSLHSTNSIPGKKTKKNLLFLGICLYSGICTEVFIVLFLIIAPNLNQPTFLPITEWIIWLYYFPTVVYTFKMKELKLPEQHRGIKFKWKKQEMKEIQNHFVHRQVRKRQEKPCILEMHI